MDAERLFFHPEWWTIDGSSLFGLSLEVKDSVAAYFIEIREFISKGVVDQRIIILSSNQASN